MSLEKSCPKICCEICGETNKNILHWHHIVERVEVNSNNSPWNISVICPSCHSKVHNLDIKIVGVWPSTNVSGRKLIYIKDGICNVEGMENEIPPHIPQNATMKVYKKDKLK